MKTITKNNKTYQIEVEIVNRFTYKVTIYEIFKNGKVEFIGKAFSNDIDMAIEEIIK